MSHSKFLGLDAMRGVAAIYVVLWHTGAYWGSLPFHHTYLAVDIFFVLSGFVIAHAYEGRFQNKSMTAPTFIVTRLIRLYPMYLLGLVLGIAWALSRWTHGMEVYAVGHGQLLSVVVLSLLFLPSHLDPSLSLFPLNGPSWSLFYELVVNAAYGVTRRFLSNAVLVALLCVTALVLAYSGTKVGNLDIGVMAGPKSMFAANARACFGMGYGFIIYRGYTSGYSVPEFLRIQLAPMVVMSVIFLLPNFGSANWLVDFAAVVLILPACVLWSASTPTPPRLAGLYAFLGMISYPLYALHWPLGGLGEVFFKDAITRHRPIGGVVFTLGSIALCAVIVRYVDEPVRGYLTRRFLPKKRAAKLPRLDAPLVEEEV